MKVIFLALVVFFGFESTSRANVNLDYITNIPTDAAQVGFSDSKSLRSFKRHFASHDHLEKILDLSNLHWADANYDQCLSPREFERFLASEKLWKRTPESIREKQLRAFLSKEFVGIMYEGNKAEFFKVVESLNKNLTDNTLYVFWNTIIKGKWGGEDKSLTNEEVLSFEESWNGFLKLPQSEIHSYLNEKLISLKTCKELPGVQMGSDVTNPLEKAEEVAAIVQSQLADIKSIDQWTGTSGIAAFFGALYGKTKKSEYLNLSLKLFSDIEKTYATAEPDSSIVGGATGMGLSALYAYRVSKDERFLEIAKRFGKLSVLNTANDYAVGSVGIGIFKLNLYFMTKDQAWLNEAMKAGDQLIQTALVNEEGTYWESSAQLPAIFSGFGHGSAGAGYLLIHLYGLTKNESYKDMALKAADHVLRTAYIDQNGDYHWTMYQPGPGYGGSWKNQWSHGNVGNSYFFQSLNKFVPSRKWKNALAHTFKPVVIEGIDYRYDDGSQCCGKSSQGELYLTLYRETKKLKYLELAKTAARYLVDENGKVKDYYGRNKTKYDMSYSGLSGIGHYFLQLTDAKELDLPYQIYRY